MDLYDRLMTAGLPAYPPFQLQAALYQAAHRHRLHAIFGSGAVTADSATGCPAQGPGVHVLGTNHLSPWAAAHVGRAALQLSQRSPGLGSIAVELPPSWGPRLQVATHLLAPVLEELYTDRFRRVPALQALQRLTSYQAREGIATALMQECGLDKATELRVWGFTQGLDLLAALHIGQKLEVHTECVDIVSEEENDAPFQGSVPLGQPGTAGSGGSSYLDGTLDSVPTRFNAAAQLGGLQKGSRSQVLTSEGWKPAVGVSSSASRHQSTRDILQGKADQSLAMTDALASCNEPSSSGRDSSDVAVECGASASGNTEVSKSGRWSAAAQMQANFAGWGMDCLTTAVDRGLVCAEEYEVMGPYLRAWASKTALMRPGQLGRALHGSTEEPVHSAREAHMAARIATLPRPVLAIVGAAHVPGVVSALRLMLR